MANLPALAILDSNEVGDEPSFFERLPREILVMILERMTIPAFNQLRGTSSEMKQICEAIRFPPELRIKSFDTDNLICLVFTSNLRLTQIPINSCRIRIEKCHLAMDSISTTDEDIFEGRRVTIENVLIDEDVNCPVDRIVRFLEDHSVEKVEIGYEIRRPIFHQINTFLQHPIVRNLSRLTVWLTYDEVLAESIFALRDSDFRLHVREVSIERFREFLHGWPKEHHPGLCLEADKIRGLHYDLDRPHSNVQRILDSFFRGFCDFTVNFQQVDPVDNVFLRVECGGLNTIETAFVCEAGSDISVSIH